jgi:hypothetical protein
MYAQVRKPAPHTRPGSGLGVYGPYTFVLPDMDDYSGPGGLGWLGQDDDDFGDDIFGGFDIAGSAMPSLDTIEPQIDESIYLPTVSPFDVPTYAGVGPAEPGELEEGFISSGSSAPTLLRTGETAAYTPTGGPSTVPGSLVPSYSAVGSGGQPLTVTPGTAAPGQSASTGYANAPLTGAVSIPGIGSVSTTTLLLGAVGIAALVLISGKKKR